MADSQGTADQGDGNRYTGQRLKGANSPRVHVSVTQDVIDQSTRKDSSHCMIAEAIAKKLASRASFISVDLATIRFTDLSAGIRYVYLTPRVAQLSREAIEAVLLTAS